MPGTTAFPGALDDFPSIDANTHEDAPGVEHDVVHGNVHAAIAALQVKLGVDESDDPLSIDARVAALEDATTTVASGGVVGCTFDGGGTVLAAGSFCDVVVPANCTILAATVLADKAGSAAFSVWADSYANFPPTIADNIAATSPPTLVSASKSRNTALTGWTITLAAGAVVRFGVTSCSLITRATITLEVSKTS